MELVNEMVSFVAAVRKILSGLVAEKPSSP
jgi:hypothetical protein